MEQDVTNNLKILISCHKEVILPQSEVYLPMQVGAANTDVRLPGMQPDNEGENISDRNFTFCELTAQYWAWKNLEADYVGLCHYRRFFCFDGQKHAANDHQQIEADALSPYSIRDFRLDDGDLIRNAIADCDVLTAPLWDVSKTVAPGGVKDTVAEHMIAYGLFEKSDLDMLRSIIAERQPAYLSYFDAYVNGRQYLGYSCYVMRRDLFDKFCEFEFDVLLAFDKQFDYQYLTSTRRRICGYFGEILYSVFIEYLRAEGQARIKQAPLVFFLDTSSCPFKGEATEGAKVSLEIVWRYRDFSTSAFLAGVQSLVDHVDASKEYRLTILHEENFIYPNLEIALPSIPSNLSIVHAHWTAVPILQEWPDLSVDDLDVLESALLPWLTSTDHPLLWIDGLAAFQADPARLLEAFEESNDSGAAGLQNIVLQRELNKPKNHGILDAYALSTRRVCFTDSTVLLIEPNRMRARYDLSDIGKEYDALKRSCSYIPSPKPRLGETRKKDFKLTFYDHSNQAFRARLTDMLGISYLPFEGVSTSTHYSDTIEWANAQVAREWQSARDAVLIYCEYGRIPLREESTYLAAPYWDAARRSNAYETLLTELFDPDVDTILKRFLPAGTKRGQMARRILHKVKG